MIATHTQARAYHTHTPAISNTVLDDNCTLCLPNGERIKLAPATMRMLFEV